MAPVSLFTRGAEWVVTPSAKAVITNASVFPEDGHDAVSAAAGEFPGSHFGDESDASPSASTPPTVTLSLSVYWTVMVLVMVLVREHHRRTEGLILRRIKTFCLAGTMIFSLMLTRRIAKVR